ncbi:DUF6542 domain-containing protein [Streptomyces millisiae]|uniref:DUF6542 domain-containing protein n=1 Tax=Streptomyces millisiae TaxID=3075542 RepID=A0ABU2LTT3_9ACTN|nr:DUF6542 domain-containing protein [Streptomyces sp. DSM 44918]MDT0321002.1 hypothetical protein [Streptomyces sp. DSM 44918]
MRTTVPRPAGRVPAAGRQPRPARRLPRARLTGLGCGVLAVASMVAAAWLCKLIGGADGAPTYYGALFIATSAAVSLWVRPADLVCAPVAAPIAFAVGLLSTNGLLETVTTLALSAPWVFAGTMTACAITLSRSCHRLLRGRAERRAAARGR